MTLEEAKEKQFQLVSSIAREFQGNQFFQTGDVGVTPSHGRPLYTQKVERVLASLFQTEDCALVRGSGTGAIRSLLSNLLEPNDSIFIHKSPIYYTTRETFRMMNLQTIVIDYHSLEEVKKQLLAYPNCHLFYVQHSRQSPDDFYNLGELIQFVRKVRPQITIVVDDNYTVFKSPKIGVELGATYSCFSGFKLLGPPGIGIVVGKEQGIQRIHRQNYSGGGQVQGFEAMELLRSLVLAPVSIAVQNEQVERIAERLQQNEVPCIRKAYITNSQSKNVIVELSEPIAKKVMEKSEQLGAAVYPVGAESRYEILPMIYRLSGSFLEDHPELTDYGLRINPMRAGADLVISILKKSVIEVLKEQK